MAIEKDYKFSLMALVKVFESTYVLALDAHDRKKETALLSAWFKVPGPKRARHRKSNLIESGTAFRLLQQSEKEACNQSKEDNKIVKIYYWEEAPNISVIGGCRKPLVKINEVSKSTSRKKT